MRARSFTHRSFNQDTLKAHSGRRGFATHGARMAPIRWSAFDSITRMVTAALLMVAWIAPVAAQEDRPRDEGVHRDRGTGVGIGIGIGVLQGLTKPAGGLWHRSPDPDEATQARS